MCLSFTKHAPQDLSWNAGKKFMGNVDSFLKSLQNFDKDNIPLNCVDKVSIVVAPAGPPICTQPVLCCRSSGADDAEGLYQVEKDYISNAGFAPANIKSKSGAAAGLCSWVVNICKYVRIYQVSTAGQLWVYLKGSMRFIVAFHVVALRPFMRSAAWPHCYLPCAQVVAPKRAALADANRKLENATRKLSTIRAKVKELNDSVAALEAHLMKVFTRYRYCHTLPKPAAIICI